MARKRKRARAAVATPPVKAAAPAASPPSREALPHWHWRTFPVYFAFVAGMLVASSISQPIGTIGVVVRLIAIAAFGYGLAHMFVRNVIVAGRVKRRLQAKQRGEEPEEEFEEELVYPDETPSEK